MDQDQINSHACGLRAHNPVIRGKELVGSTKNEENEKHI